MAKSRKPDAAESNAGDDFHVLWTIRKSLELLNFSKDGLKAVSIEGLTSADEKVLTSDGDILLGVDLTEYYGGDSFITADSVIVSQLKYSTRHPDQTWTTSGICKGKKHAWQGSIIHRLATFFSGFSKDHARDKVLQRIKLKLVSNRPVATDLQSALTEVQQLLQKKGEKVSIAFIIKQLNATSAKIVQKLYQSSGLKSQQFTDFIRLLDLSDCNVDSRFFQKQKLLKAISESGNYDAKKEFEQLYGLIRNKMMPEGRDINTLKQVDILYEFGFADLRDLLPVTSRLQTHEKLIDREQVADIITAITDSANPLIALHGGAGIGKSTIVSLIARNLSPGSLPLIYDCYGGGTYLDSEDKRHKHENAFLQLSNDLALQTGTPFLLTRNLSADIYLKEFRKRMELASRIIRKVNPTAVLVVIIDAADNSVNAASQYKESCFVHDLVKMSIPEGCMLVITARSERLASVELPDSYKDIPIKPFSEMETLSFLKQFYPSISQQEAAEFWKLTTAIPRVMSYALDMPGTTLKDKLKPLKPGGKTLDDIFKARIREAERRSGNKAQITSFLTYLINLPRPVPAQYIRQVSGMNDDLLTDISTDLWRGLIYHNASFSFRDEDFENYLRKYYPADSKKFAVIAETFLANAEQEEYASAHLGTALSNAGKKNELQEIVLDRKYLQHPQDPIKNKEVFIERTRLAMRMSATETSNLNLVKLQMVAAEAAKTNKVLEDILLNSAELASSYGNLQMNQKLYFQSGNPEWFGSVHFRSAAVFSRDKETHNLAREHMGKANNWLAYRNKLDEEAKEKFKLTIQDIAYGAEAVLRLSGVEACIDWLKGWKPKTSVYRAIQVLLYKLIETSDKKQLEKWLKDKELRIDIRMLIIKVCFTQGIKPPVPVEPVLKSVDFIKRVNQRFKLSLFNELMAFCEYSLMTGVSYEEVKDWIDMIVVETPRHVPSFTDTHYSSLGEAKYDMDLLFRKACIKAEYENIKLEVKDFYPEALIKSLTSSTDHEKRSAEEQKGKFDQLYKHFLPVYKVRADFLFKTAASKSLLKQLQSVLDSIEKDYDLPYRHNYDLKYIFKFLSVRLLDISFHHRSEALVQMIEKGFLIRGNNNILLYLALAERISSLKDYQPMVLKLLQRTEEAIEKDTLPGAEQLEYYTMATVIASRVSKESGKYYFDKMVLSSNEVDIEGHQQIKSFSELVDTEKSWKNPKLAFEFGRYVEYCYERLRGWDHFPWGFGIAAVAKLDPGTALAAICRLDHRKVRDLDRHYTEILKEAVDQGYIDHITAAALLPINKNYWPDLNEFIKIILAGFDKENDHLCKEIFVRAFIRDLQLHFSPNHHFKTLQLFWELIKDGKHLKTKTVEGFREYFEKVTVLINGKVKEEDPGVINYSNNVKDKKFNQHLKKIDISDTKQISDLIVKLKNENANNYINAELFFQTIRNKVDADHYVSHLEALINLDPDIVTYWSFKNALFAAITEWGFHPEVKQWKKQAFFPFLKAKFSHLISYEYFDIEDLKKHAALFEVTDIQLSDYILKLIPEYLDELTTSILYQLLEITAIDLTKPDKLALLEWIVPRWSEKIKDEFGDGVWNETFLPPVDNEMTVAKFIRYNLGHPDKRVRWRAAHSLRRFASLKKMAVINHLIAQQDDKNCGQFQYGEFPFYWLSAKLFLWISIERIAKENGGILFPYSGDLIKELKNKELPHAQIKYFIKSACEALTKQDKTIFNAEALDVINKTLVCKLISKPAVKPSSRGSYRRGDITTKFKFDTMDTVPYWYSSLAEALDCTTNDILLTADKFITTVWGYTGDTRKNDPAASGDWALTSNRHGSEPTIENLHTYFEYHAMFCAAGELLETKEVVDDPEKYRDWKEWIKSWALCWDDFWLSDLRDPIPLLPKFWVNRKSEPDWEWNIQPDDFDKTIGLKDAEDNSYIPVNLGIRIQYGKDSESISVSSALVNPKYASSLLKALQTSERLDHYIPLEKDRDYDYDDDDKKDKRFRLKGWIKRVTTEREGIDDNDELFQDIDRSRLVPGSEFHKWARLKITDDYRFSYQGNDPADWVTWFETWSNHKKEEYYGSFSASGSRLLIKKAILLDYLKATNQCLILDCGIRRRMERTERYEYYPDYTYIYLIHPNGKVETLSREYQLR